MLKRGKKKGIYLKKSIYQLRYRRRLRNFTELSIQKLSNNPPQFIKQENIYLFQVNIQPPFNLRRRIKLVF